MTDPFTPSKPCGHQKALEAQEAWDQQLQERPILKARFSLETAICALSRALEQREVVFDREDAFHCLKLLTEAWNDLRGLDQ